MSTRIPQDRGPATPRRGAPLLGRFLRLSAKKGTGDATRDAEVRQQTEDGAGSSPRRAIDRLDRMNGSFNDGDSFAEDTAYSRASSIGEEGSAYDVCHTIDDSMCGLHTCTDGNERVNVKVLREVSFDHDWLLDGTDSEGEEGDLQNAKIRRRRKFGDDALDQMLGMLEIENASYATSASSCGSYLDGGSNPSSNSPGAGTHQMDEDEGVIEFADFSHFDAATGAMGDGDHGESNKGAESGDDVFATEGNLQHDVLYEYERTEPGEEKPQSTPHQAGGTNSIEEDAAIEEGIKHAATLESASSYEPPSSIQCLVSDLDAELDVTIKTCLDVPAQKSVTESACSSLDDDCTNLQDDKEENQSLLVRLQNKRKQSLLMSSTLLEGLPLPLPSASSDDPLASLTRRIQTHHVASTATENADAGRYDAAQLEDGLLKVKLADVIHSGYFASGGEYCDSDHFDSVVMEEVLNVPWPFHIIDVKESFLEDDPADSEDDSDESIDHLNFDSYVSNRLSELDMASGEIMKCILSRVGQKADSIQDGIEGVYAAELDVSTALLMAQTSREALDHAKNGYDVLGGKHNVVSGALDVVRFADCKDRLRYLLQTIDRISAIRDQEANWWNDVSAKTIHPERFQTLVDEARSLITLVTGEEVLNHTTSLRPMRDRMIHLPDALRRRIEDSLADLFRRMVTSAEKCPSRFDGHCLEYETLLQSWLSCCRLKANNEQSLDTMASEWSSCLLKIYSFEAGRAFACAMVEHEKSDDGDDGTLAGIQTQLNQMKFESTDEEELESLSNKLLVMRLGGGHDSSALASTFFHLCSRLVELMNLYKVSLQWHQAIIGKHNPAVDDSTPNAGGVMDQSECAPDESELNHHASVSTMSSDRQSVSTSDEASIDPAPEDEAVSTSVPEHLEIETHHLPSRLVQLKAMETSMLHIRLSLWKKCEASLINIVEFYHSQGDGLGVQSADSTDFATGNLRLTYHVLLQLADFSCYFLGEEREEDELSSLKNELSKLYHSHIRSVFVEAMKTTGTLLRHEPWQLAPLELKGGAFKGNMNGTACRGCRVPGQRCAQCNASTMQAVYEAVGDLFLSSAGGQRKAVRQTLITARSQDRGFAYCTSFAQYLEATKPNDPASPTDGDPSTSQRLKGCLGMSSTAFSSTIQQFVEMKPCGERSFPILTQSSANGLVKWTARLLAIGEALPLVTDDASAAVIKLFDLYILTVLRLCAASKANENVLIGFGRGTTARSASSATVSLTMGADALAPLPREAKSFASTQDFVNSSRKRLENMVNLDKFQSLDDEISPASPRSDDAASNAAKRLEKEAAAACSCLFAAILVDVASMIFRDGRGAKVQQQPLWDDLRDLASSIEKEEETADRKSESLVEYAQHAVSAMPLLVTQATRFATANALSGKEMIFQIICAGRVWEDNIMQEQSNAYVDDLCERFSGIWGYMSSSMRLPQPTLQFAWDQLVRSAFLLLLEGFSKVSKCSTEGRSLMSIDLATLSHGLVPESVQAEVEDEYPNISPPPQACREEMMRCVDTWVKVFYFPDEDTVKWIRVNAGDYHFDHSLSLVTSTPATSKQEKKLMADNKKVVADIYDAMK